VTRQIRNAVSLVVDGREVTAPEGTMLHDAAKMGDVEIPVFCYEPKLGDPVGACRMCLVEVEGMPKLQTSCSTPIRDGMVVYTQTDRVKEAQNAVVEFLLVNHPLDCPVCDKGGECPLQDIAMGWGPGKSRFTDPKRHFQKPLELSPLVAIDRERCILCYRCVRFSQEVAEDEQLQLLERGDKTFVGTFDERPYIAPFHGNVIELCPVGALTSTAYRFRARPWDVETAGSVCTLCAAQCNVSMTVRDDKVSRVMARDHHEVDDGWLCDKGRFAYQAFHVDERITEPLAREGDELRPVSWDRAIATAAAGLARAGSATAALVGGQATNEEGFLVQRLLREGLDAHDLDSRLGAVLPVELHRALGAPALQASVPDLEFAHAVLVLDCEPVDDMPIVDLRIRKGVRRRGVKLAVATSRPSSLDANAKLRTRFAPGAGEALLAALDAALGVAAGEARRDEVGRLAEAAGTEAGAVHALADLLADAGADVVILYGERLLSGPRADHVARALLNVAGRLRVTGAREGAGLLCVPSGTNGRGLAEVGVLPDAGPGFSDAAVEGRSTAQIAGGAAAGELTALYLLHTDPLRDLPHGALWRSALDTATTVVAHADFLTEGIREFATVVFPSESYAEKEGTVTHPDGRLQRLRRSIAHQGETQAEWALLVELARRIGLELDVPTGPVATGLVAAAVPFYAGITPDEIGGRGVRWQDRDAASAFAFEVDLGPFELEPPPPSPAGSDGRFLLGTFRSVWAASEVEVSPALRFLHPRQRAELAPADAQRLGLLEGDRVVIGSNGTSVQATVALRAAMPPGSVFLQDAIPEDSASALEGPLVEVRKA
jgi:NADH-quinone oxidoreductase subunit G